MVSTRSGRVVSAAETSHGRVTRSRSKKESDINAEELEAETLAAEAGQPEVNSPFPTPSKEFEFRPAQPETFGSPVPPSFMQRTPVQEQMLGTPFQERVVKTVGKAAATPTMRTPAAAAAPTPSAKEVMHTANVPLPDDDATEEPYATSEDEPLVPASPAQDQPAEAHEEQPQRKCCKMACCGGRLFCGATVASLLATLIVGLLLAPCSDPELFAMVPSDTYGPLCQNVVSVRSEAAEMAARFFAQALEKAAAVQDRLPPPTLQFLEKTWQHAAAAAGPAFSAAGAVTSQHLSQLQVCVKESWQRFTRATFSLLGPKLRQLLAHGDDGLPLSSASAPAGVGVIPITCMEQSEFLAIVDPSQQQYAQDLWDFAGRQVADKQKAAAWVLTCRHEAECAAAMGGLFSAATSIYHIDGGAYGESGDAGKLHHEMVTFLRGYPQGLVLVTKPERLHPNSLVVLNNALSESGHLMMDGQPVATAQALYVVLVHHAAGSGEGVDVEAEVKEWLGLAISKVDPSADPKQVAAVVLSFRRRLDAVLPARPVPGN